MENESGPELTLRQKRHESRAGSTWKAFLREVSALGQLSIEDAERASASVLCNLERRLRGEEAEDLLAQLPVKLQELVRGCALHAGEKPEKFGKAEFFARVGDELGKSPAEAEAIARAVITVIRAQISEGEAEDVGGQLPRDLAELWARPS